MGIGHSKLAIASVTSLQIIDKTPGTPNERLILIASGLGIDVIETLTKG